MAATITDLVGGAFYNMEAIHPLYKDNKLNLPARNLFRNSVMMKDAVIQQANELMGHQGSFGSYGGRGAEAIKIGGYRSTSTVSWGSFRDDISIFSDASAIPKDVVDLQGMAFRSEEEATKADAFMQSCENHLIYGTNGATTDTFIHKGTSTTPTPTPEKYTGFAPRFRTPDNGGSGYDAMNPDPTTAAQAGVWDALGTGTDTTSMWFIRWGKRAASLITPLNDPQYGLKIEDLGLQKQDAVNTSSGNPTGSYRRVWMTEFEYKHGLSLYPGEYGGAHVARIRNIENSVSADHSALKGLIFQVIEEYFLRATEGVFMYLPPRMMTIFDILLEAKTNIEFTLQNPYQLSPENWAGKVFLRPCQSININETAVAAA